MPNHLASSNSLYLKKHANNPIDWWPWCEEALEKAKKEDKPIFLSVGYSSCHWCTVMEGEAFSDDAIAQYMNENFVAIKVDREERPDIDSIYMQALQMMTGHGGWPLNIFLTPGERVPFYGGTYFPIDPRYNRPSFLRILQSLRNFYDTDKEKLRSIQGEILQQLQQGAALSIVDETDELVDNDAFRLAVEVNAQTLLAGEPGPRFPMIPHADLVLRGARFKEVKDVTGSSGGDAWREIRYDPWVASRQRGLDLVLGGIFDHVGGGFHRYTVDPSWTVPHFEKMLYDNGQIMEYLANLWSAGMREPAFKRAIAKTVQWLKREMLSPEGYFYAAQDADNFVNVADPEPEEGAFYVWTYQDLSQSLSSEALADLQDAFSVTSSGNFDGKNVLQRITSGALSSSLETTLDTLFAQRYGYQPASSLQNVVPMVPARTNEEAKTLTWKGRIPPVTDTKMIVAWNSLMISGLARAAAVFHQVVYLEMAVNAATFILKHQILEGRFHRLNYDGIVSIKAQSEDYAFFIKALLDIDQACLAFHSDRSDGVTANKTVLGKSWVDHAIALQAEFDEWLWCVERGGYYNTSRDTSDQLIVRERSYSDNATPSANGVAIANLVRLFLQTETADYWVQANDALKAFKLVLSKFPQACPSLFSALDWRDRPITVKVADHQMDALNTYFTQNNSYVPTSVLQQTDNVLDGAVGLICRGMSCNEPLLNLEQLHRQLRAIY